MKVPSAADVKKLDSELKNISLRINEQKKVIADAQRVQADLEFAKTQLEQRLRLMNAKTLFVTEHAVLRYVERVMRINTQQVESKLAEKLQKIYSELGDGLYEITADHVARIKDGRVVTVMGKNKPEKE